MRRIFAVLTIAFLSICHYTKAYAEDYSILVLRVEFPYEEPDHDTTSGRGVFLTEAEQEYAHPWDIPPHDKQYCENHLEALKNYWDTVSEGRIGISYEVWPKEPDAAYTMSNMFYKYGNGRTQEQTFEKLALLVEEAVMTCKNSESSTIKFSEFDTFMIIHAGMGGEASQGLNDIPSAFLSNEDFDRYLATPIVIDGRTVDNCIVVPEMASQNGLAGLNGIMAQMFGYRLGLPSLSNNEDGIPAAGAWCLMDIGSIAWGYGTIGYIPPHPCIWSKIDLGWITPVEVTSDSTIDIAATNIYNGLPRGVKIPITDDEYLLLENRYSPTSRDSLPDSIAFSGPDSSGVFIKTGNYDAFIPGNGLLIWHVNDRIIRENRPDNTINDDPHRRGLDLLEADGRQDIGALFGFGDPRAEYAIGHEDDTFKQNGSAVLSPETIPNSNSIWGGNSGITVTVNSDPGVVMNVSIHFAGKLNGFPLFVGSEGNITAADLNNNGADELIVSNSDSSFIIDSAGKIVHTFPQQYHPAVFHDTNSGRYNLAASVLDSEKIISGYSLYRLDGSELSELKNIPFEQAGADEYSTDGRILATETQSGMALLFDIFMENRNSIESGIRFSAPYESVEGTISLPDMAHIRSMAAANDYISVLGTDNTLYYGYIGDTALASYQINADTALGPLLVDIDRDTKYETTVTTDSELIILYQDGTTETAFLPDEPVGAPVAADIDADGYPEIVQCTIDGIAAYRAGGIIADNFPFDLPPGDDSERITSPPVIVDLDGDGFLDIACATSNKRIVSYDASGQMTPGFPLAVSGLVTNQFCIFKLNDSGNCGLAYITEDGVLMAHDLSITIDDDLYQWPMLSGGPELTSVLLNSEISSDLVTTAPFEAYCYPNPITGETGTFRIIPSSPSDCTITVFTADGRKVYEGFLSRSEVIPGVPNELKMNTGDLASGLYIAKITAGANTVIYKLGVLK